MIQDPGITLLEELDWRLHSYLMHMTFRTADAFCGLQAAAPGEIRRSPLYAQVSAAIERRLLERAWPIDSALPPEPELARIFGVSVGTVRKAVDELEALGEYNEGDDYGLYVNAKREAWVEMHEGDLVVTPPCDAHKPGCCTEAGPAKLKKACVKVLVD